jgi:hypothetical protein
MSEALHTAMKFFRTQNTRFAECLPSVSAAWRGLCTGQNVILALAAWAVAHLREGAGRTLAGRVAYGGASVVAAPQRLAARRATDPHWGSTGSRLLHTKESIRNTLTDPCGYWYRCRIIFC